MNLRPASGHIRYELPFIRPELRAHSALDCLLVVKLSLAAVRSLRKHRDPPSSPHAIFKSNTTLKQCIVVRRAIIYDHDGADDIRSWNEAGRLAAQIPSPASHPRARQPPHQMLKQCIFFRRERIYEVRGGGSTFGNQDWPSKPALSLNDSLTPSPTRQHRLYRANSIGSSPAPSASRPPPQHRSTCRASSMTSASLQLFLSAAHAFAMTLKSIASPSISSATLALALVPKWDPRPRSHSRLRPSPSPLLSGLASSSTPKLIIYPRLSPQVRPLFEPASPQASGAHPELSSDHPKLTNPPSISPALSSTSRRSPSLTIASQTIPRCPHPSE
ncbi:uncharacterized protein SCHCODRAFT_02687422 [Schizophyllum commune H4-8]|nr:uncharacterized protein SCHCODRAFT_02687422 [Schizophyllum commune H4-8]KAI5893335.1 hypothetical protein SCHCODRAFT_02687422 [Schizophyllum commune H4-8]